MSFPSTYPGQPDETTVNQMYQFGDNPFLIWNDELQTLCEPNIRQWQFDYSYLPQLPQQASVQVLKDIANVPDSRGSTLVTSSSDQQYLCATVPFSDTTTSFGMSECGLRIDNVDTTLEQATRWDVPIPAIVTEPATRNNTVDEVSFPKQSIQGLQISHADSNPYHFGATPPQMACQPECVRAVKSAPAMQDVFQFNTPETRRNSVSSCNSGPVFSHYGTPTSTYPHESAIGTPYSMQGSSFGRHLQWSPRSPAATWQPQSRKQSSASLSRMSQEYFNALQKHRTANGVSMTVPTRRKPRIDRGLSDSSLFSGPLQSSADMKSGDSRKRAASAVGQEFFREASSSKAPTHLPLPMFQPEKMSTSPVCTQVTFPMYAQTTPKELAPVSIVSSYIAPDSRRRINVTPSPTFDTHVHPSDPPPSDFQDRPQAQMPMFQAPQFDGDIYTPQYKRRNAKGEWEGWCGLCQPGQWHNLKNSRYWDDKLRNHGICARTKRKFEDPIQLRVVNLEGNVIDLNHELGGKAGATRGDEWVVSGLDGSLRKREGLCGYCNEWIAMDGARSRAKGKSVGWWSHAYKCHEQGRKISPGDQLDNQINQPPQYNAQTPDQAQQVQYLSQPVYFSQTTNSSYMNC